MRATTGLILCNVHTDGELKVGKGAMGGLSALVEANNKGGQAAHGTLSDTRQLCCYRVLSASGRRRRKGRRGVAVLVVLLLIAITMAVSYATMRSQGTALMIQQNAGLGTAARQAAFTGMTIGLKQMHTGSWAGVDSALKDTLGEGTSYVVAYFAGDASLAAGDPDYAELPYRVTVLATGQAVDATDPTRVATHQIRVVARLVPRDLGPQPVDWERMQAYTVYQSKADRFEVDVPCRIEGPVRAQWKVKVAKNYPDSNNAWERYLSDLNAMRGPLQLDYRPFDGPIDLPLQTQDVKHRDGLAIHLGVTLNDLPAAGVNADFVKPTLPSSYRIFPGGPVYTIPAVLTNPLQNTTLEADPLINPLGLFYRELNLSVRDNVTIRGSLICRDDVKVEGTNVHFEPVELPSLYGSDAPIRLPVVTCHKFHVEASAGGSLTGLLAAFNDFHVRIGPETVAFLVTGRVITPKFLIEKRQPWDTESWNDRYSDFEAQPAGASPEPYFPVWMGRVGRYPKPLIRIVPDSTPVDYGWKMSYDTIFLPHSDDDTPQDPNNPGLRWDLLEWTDRP